jgi:hypothetical protein
MITRSGDTFFFVEKFGIECEKLEPGNYVLNWNEKTQDVFLVKIQDFSFPDPLINFDEKIISYVTENFHKFDRNVGVLLTGEKGMGKSVTARLICKKLNLPVIILDKKIPSNIDFISFLNKLNSEFVLLVDEFEKIFSCSLGDNYLYQDNDEFDDEKYHSQKTFLTFLDGLNFNLKSLTILTTNNRISSYFLNRPSRIKFLKSYQSLNKDMMNSIIDRFDLNDEIVKDLNDHLIPDNLNIDLLLSIIKDIKLFNKKFSEFKDIYNIVSLTDEASVYFEFNPEAEFTKTMEYQYMDQYPYDEGVICRWIDGKLPMNSTSLYNLFQTFLPKIVSGLNQETITITGNDKIEYFIKTFLRSYIYGDFKVNNRYMPSLNMNTYLEFSSMIKSIIIKRERK